MVAESSRRVEANTSPARQREIDAEMAASLEACARELERAEARLAELDREWDVERAIELNASALMLGGLVLSLTVDRKWIVLPLAVSGFLMQHAVQGWCPPIPVLRWLGVRTAREIERERYALKALRGDFRQIPGPREADAPTAVMAALRATA